MSLHKPVWISALGCWRKSNIMQRQIDGRWLTSRSLYISNYSAHTFKINSVRSGHSKSGYILADSLRCVIISLPRLIVGQFRYEAHLLRNGVWDA